jgi:uncharacterized protein
MLYIDTSVLVAYYCPEAISEQVEDILINTSKPAISHLTEIELVSAVSRKIRDKALTQEQGNKIVSQFNTHIDQKSYTYLPLQSIHYLTARDWIAQFNTPLRTLDALHLAIATKSNIPILTADLKFAKSAKILGVEIITV